MVTNEEIMEINGGSMELRKNRVLDFQINGDEIAAKILLTA